MRIALAWLGLVFLLLSPLKLNADPLIMDPVVVEQKLDAMVPFEMEQRHLPGAVIVLVDRDRTILMKGYGVSDLVTASPVDPQATQFRIASVSKIFTTTAVMQLYERGKINLDRDINAYLHQFQVPETFPDPMTARHLLTHTSGLGSRFLSSRSRTRKNQTPLGDYLAKKLPSRFIAPGEIFSYANHGMALAGYAVESVSGRPFHDYVAEEILKPLGMRHSGFGMGEPLLEKLATGYVFSSGSYYPVPVDFRNEVPSGSMITTGADMVRFMQAFLNGGTLDGVPILKSSTVAEMTRRQFSHHPRMDGVCFGFIELRIGSHRCIGHYGDIKGYNGALILAPEQGLGLFMAYTGSDTLKAFPEIIAGKVFEDISEPQPSGLLNMTTTNTAVIEHAGGTYRWTRGPRDSFERLVVPYWLVQYKVVVEPAGTLSISNPLGLLASSRWEPVDDRLFQEVGGNRFLSFREDSGVITHLFMESGIPMALERISWFETIPVQLGLFAFFVAGFLAIALMIPLRMIRRTCFADSPVTSRPIMAIIVTSACNIFFLFAFPRVIGLNMLSSDLLELPRFLLTPGNPPFFYGPPKAALVLLMIPILNWVSIGALILSLIDTWQCNMLTWKLGVATGGFIAFVLGFLIFLNYWNLFGYKL